MATGSSTVPTVKAAVANVLGKISGLKVYGYEPRELDSTPAVTIQTTQLGRVNPDQAEDELGRDSLWHTYTVRLYVAIDDPESAESGADALLGQLIGGFDSDPTLGNSPGVIDSKIVSSDYGELMRDSKPMLGYVCQLRVLQEVS